MREIKFRAWDNIDYMSSPFTLQDLQDRKIQFTSDCVVMQFTGLRDKNGTEIYEGDIVKVGGGFASIVWKDGGFALHSPGSEAIDWVMMDFIPNNAKVEIIGNIHQNPELCAS